MIWQDFQRPAQVDYEEEGQGPTFGRFLAQPFERGWGTTLGNSLRRALLSSIPSAAITAVKIEGADHEFSAVPGVVEDVTDIILNLKKIPLKIHGQGPAFLNLEAKGPGEVTAIAHRDGEIQRGIQTVALFNGYIFDFLENGVVDPLDEAPIIGIAGPSWVDADRIEHFGLQ